MLGILSSDCKDSLYLLSTTVTRVGIDSFRPQR